MINKDNPQLALWAGSFGYEYSHRDGNALDAADLTRLRRNWGQMLSRAVSPPVSSALEVGANIGRNLMALTGLVPRLHAIEPNEQCCAEIRANPVFPGIDVHCASAFKIPYEDDAVDLTFTSGVLIHIAPETLGDATDEIVRVSRHYVMCIEYFSRNPVSIPYRQLGDGFLFKRDFGRWYLDRYPRLEVVDYGFLWSRVDAGDDLNWWLFRKRA